MIHVVAAVVTDAAGRVLIAQRPPGKQLAGFWEFPGGKLEAGESRTEGLARELEEELGIVIGGQPRPLIRLQHTFPFGDVLIDMWVVTDYSGEPQGLDGQALRWCTLAEVEITSLLPSDRPIVRALRLPERLVAADLAADVAADAMADVADGNRESGCIDGLVGRWCASADDAAAADADFLVLTQTLPDEPLAALCRAVAIPVYARSNDLAHAWALGATGIHDLPFDGGSQSFTIQGRRLSSK